jgi:hypothetical protein
MSLVERFEKLFPQLCTREPAVDETSFNIWRKSWKGWASFHLKLNPSKESQGRMVQGAVLKLQTRPQDDGAFHLSKEEMRRLAFYLTEVVREWDSMEYEYAQEYEKQQREYIKAMLDQQKSSLT